MATTPPLKYVRLKRVGFLRDIIVTFPNKVPHREFVKAMGMDSVGVISAGFVASVDGKLVCYGHSESLNRMSRPDEDTRLINKDLGNDAADSRLQAYTAALDAAHYYIDATDQELKDDNLTRDKALTQARLLREEARLMEDPEYASLVREVSRSQ